MELLLGLLFFVAVAYFVVKAIQKEWRDRHPAVVHGPDDHKHRPMLRWTDKTERFLETIHRCDCGHVLEDS